MHQNLNLKTMNYKNDLKHILHRTKINEITLVEGVLKAKFGQRKQDHFMGQHILGIRNHRGEIFAQFYLEKQLANNFYRMLKIRLLYLEVARLLTREDGV